MKNMLNVDYYFQTFCLSKGLSSLYEYKSLDSLYESKGLDSIYECYFHIKTPQYLSHLFHKEETNSNRPEPLSNILCWLISMLCLVVYVNTPT